MATNKSKAVIAHVPGNETVTLALPAYAARYLKQMCLRERTVLNNIMAAGGGYNPAIDAAFDALSQIEATVA